VLYTVLHRLLGVVLRTVWRPQVEGLEHMPPDGPLLVASNHLSFIDSIVIPLVLPRHVSFLAKAEYFTSRRLRDLPMRVFVTVMEAVPVARDQTSDAQASLQDALGVLNGGGAFGIYPEGTRSRDGRLYRGRTGVGWLALSSGAPVLPVGLVGTQRVQPIGARLPRVHRLQVRIGKPVDPGIYADLPPGRARREITDEVMDRVAELSGQQRADSYNERPAEN
jgi:1-acyl-sn-glycerol-3-phosphate acyltransferase